MRVDPHRLIRLGELIKLRSFRKAADSLNITQPALSQSIAQMEEEVGVRLIDRTPHGAVPTVFGEALAYHAQEINWHLGEAARRITELAFGHRGTLAIGATSGGPISIVALALCSLKEVAPETETRVIEETWSRSLLSQIDDRTLDAAVCHQPDESEMQGKLALPLFQARRCLCVRADHPEASDLSLSAVAKYPFACPGGEMGISYDVRRIFAEMHLDFPVHHVIVSNSLTAAKDIILNSDAFAIFTDLSVQKEVKYGLFRMVELDQVETAYWYYLVVREDYFITEALMKFISSLILVCREIGVELHPDISRVKVGHSLRTDR